MTAISLPVIFFWMGLVRSRVGELKSGFGTGGGVSALPNAR